jgi:hypothetical protein
MRPEVTEIRPAHNGSLIAATDGFWAELTAEEQVKFLQEYELPMGDNGDDRSVLQIGDLDGKANATILSDRNELANLYAKTTA